MGSLFACSELRQCALTLNRPNLLADLKCAYFAHDNHQIAALRSTEFGPVAELPSHKFSSRLMTQKSSWTLNSGGSPIESSAVCWLWLTGSPILPDYSSPSQVRTNVSSTRDFRLAASLPVLLEAAWLLSIAFAFCNTLSLTCNRNTFLAKRVIESVRCLRLSIVTMLWCKWIAASIASCVTIAGVARWSITTCLFKRCRFINVGQHDLIIAFWWLLFFLHQRSLHESYFCFRFTTTQGFNYTPKFPVIIIDTLILMMVLWFQSPRGHFSALHD